MAQGALEKYLKVLGAETVEVARVWQLVGFIRYSGQDARGAKEATEEALVIYRKVLPKDHPDIAYSLKNLGILERELRECASAKQSHEEAAAILRKALPKDHPDIARGPWRSDPAHESGPSQASEAR
jgi:hypothetical protein